MSDLPQPRVQALLDRVHEKRAELHQCTDELAFELARQAVTLTDLLAEARVALEGDVGHSGLCRRIDVALQRYTYLDCHEVRANP